MKAGSRILPLAAVPALVLLAAFAAPAKERSFSEARGEMFRLLRSKDPAERVQGVWALDGFDTPEAARTLVRHALGREDRAAVIRAAVQLLSALKAEDSLEALAGEAESGSWLKRARVVEALGRTRSETVLPAVLAAAYDEDPRVRTSALLALDQFPAGRADLAALDGLGAPEWPVRAAAMETLRYRGYREAASHLVDRLEQEQGRLREDAARTLAAISERGFGVFPAAWRAWWAAENGQEAAPVGGGRPIPPTAELAGVHTWARRIVYVLAVSETMRKEVRIDPAEVAPADVAEEGGPALEEWRSVERKDELAKLWLAWSIERLDPEVEFNVITYGASANAIFGDFEKAGPENRQRAVNRVRSLSCSGNANLYAGLMKIYQLVSRDPFDDHSLLGGPEVVFFISDGSADYGEIRDGYRAFEEAELMNRYRQIRFHCVAVGESDTRVLADLAGLASGGRIVAVP